MPIEAFAHNGAAAFATPLINITIDGDLSDWPKGMQHHAITKAEYGTPPVNEEDLSGNFRVGYDAEKRLLYVAVEVVDSSRVTNDRPDRSWDTQDGCAIYVDRQQVRNGMDVEQYSKSGPELEFIGVAVNRSDRQVAKVKVGESKGKRIYEWQLPLGKEPAVGGTLGFDVDLTDKDEDGSFTWMA